MVEWEFIPDTVTDEDREEDTYRWLLIKTDVDEGETVVRGFNVMGEPKYDIIGEADKAYPTMVLTASQMTAMYEGLKRYFNHNDTISLWR